MIAFDIFYCAIILSVIAIIIYLYIKLKQPIINLINTIKSLHELLRKFGLIKQDLDNTIKQINAARRDIASIKSRVNEINDAVIVNKINNKQNVAKTKNNKQ
ncbi:hypothetical protein [Paraprevotella clara]|uniref:hypothetical protein n=1 Tax=Paraprevotella clara TaxID=454154 RepID=UPI00266EF995|nr:hypothetical protein [Paraprevotella clara]